MIDLDRLLEALPPRVLVGGKGGVGKTTCSLALAVRSAGNGARTLLLSTDPAASLADALGDAIDAPLGGRPTPVPGVGGLHAMQLDPAAARDDFVRRWRDVLVAILDRGTYLDAADAAGLVDAALPGLDETTALLTLLELERDRSWERLVVDTAPTGHTLRLLELPRAFRALLALLDAMQEKHRFVVRALTHRYLSDVADLFLDDMRQRVDALDRAMRDPHRVAMLLVTRPDPLVLAETERYEGALDTLGIARGALIVNAATEDEAARALSSIGSSIGGARLCAVPTLIEPPVGVHGAHAWGEALRVIERPAITGAHVEQTTRSSAREGGASPAPVRIAPLTIVGGKGGVGKTTAACALAVTCASEVHPVLVVSTDPAPSVADALGQPVGEEPVPVAGAPGLAAQQLDATAAFARFRERYRERVDELFDALMPGNFDAAHDRRIVRELLSLAPPGIDELYALASLGETLEMAQWRTVIVDPAPTGHLVRLLEMPDLALEWTHRLLRLMLKYKELGTLGEATRELLEFARRTRALREMLRDPARAGVLVVTLDEPLVRAETVRLIERARSLGLAVLGVLWNQTRGAPAPLPTGAAVTHYQAPIAAPPPRGIDALRRWAAEWHSTRPAA